MNIYQNSGLNFKLLPRPIIGLGPPIPIKVTDDAVLLIRNDQWALEVLVVGICYLLDGARPAVFICFHFFMTS